MENLTEEELKARLSWYEKKYGPYIKKRGLQNWKNLFRKPTISEWTILVMMLLALFLSWAYLEDTKACSETLNNLGDICTQVNFRPSEAQESLNQANFTGLYKTLNITFNNQT